MSRSEFFQQLESLTPDELSKVAIRVEELRQRAENKDELTDTERAILDQRIKRFQADGDSGDEWPVVRERVLARLRKK